MQASQSQSQIFGDGSELSQRCCLALRPAGTKGSAEAVIDVIVDQRFLGVVDGVLNRLQLLGEFGTRSPLFDHADDGFKMPFRTPEATDDVGMVLVLHSRFRAWGRNTRIPPAG